MRVSVCKTDMSTDCRVPIGHVRIFDMAFSSPEQRNIPETTAERQQRKFEYKDATGKKICDVELVLGPMEDIPSVIPMRGRRVESYNLRYERPDKTESQLDLVSFAQRRLKHPTPMFAAEESGNAYHSESKHVVVISEGRFGDPLGPATMLHEYGHAEQEQDPRFADAIATSNLETIAASGIDRVSLNTLERLKGLLNEQQGQMVVQNVQRLRELENARYAAEGRIDVRSKELSALQSQGEMDLDKIKQIQMLETTILEARHSLDAGKEEQTRVFETIKPLLSIPTQITERNATARALLNLRELRDAHGLDLLVPVKRDAQDASLVEKEWYKEKNKGECETQVEGTFKRLWNSLLGKKTVPEEKLVSTAQERLTDYALSTYEAKTSELWKKYGYIPTPMRQAQDAFIDAQQT